MKNTKKIVAIALALVMVFGMAASFTGCAQKPVELPDSSNIAAEESTADPTSEPTDEPTPTPEENFEYASVVYISVNPKFAIYFDADGKVIKTTAENDDGEALDVDLADLNNMTSSEAVTALLETIKDAGYFEDGKHNIELTFYGETKGAVKDLKTLTEIERTIYDAAAAFVKEEGIKAEVKVKRDPDVAPEQAPTSTSAPTAGTPESEDNKDAEKEETDASDAEVAPTAKPTAVPTAKPTKAPTSTHTHDYHSDTVKPTCTAGGYTKYTCNCGSTYTDKETAKLGHNYTETVVKATYDAGGYTLHTCTVCGYAYKSNETAAIPRPTAAPTAAPTQAPTDDSAEKDVTCSYCGGNHYLYECSAAAEATPEPVKCGFCGSTTCAYPSTGDATNCPAYDIKNDARYYCQTCGESTSICEFWIVDKECPRCGASVAAFECHYCPNR